MMPVNRSRICKIAAVALVLLIGLWIGYIHVRHRLAHGHFAPLAFHADILVHDASIGIPGITKMYEGALTNYGLLPALIETCRFMSDTADPGAMAAYNIERWDASKHAWTGVMEFAKPGLCTPVLGMGSTHWSRSWLWPGQSVSTQEEATGARHAFNKGDTLRFVIVSNVTGTGKGNASYPTPPFTLDEQKLDDSPAYRVSH
jgi:hypothetical protein